MGSKIQCFVIESVTCYGTANSLLVDKNDLTFRPECIINLFVTWSVFGNSAFPTQILNLYESFGKEVI